MSTHANFYVGTGANAEWLGSLHRDGMPHTIPAAILRAPYEAEYRRLVREFLTQAHQQKNGAQITGGAQPHAYDYCFAPAHGSKGPHVWWPAADSFGEDPRTKNTICYSHWTNCEGGVRTDRPPFPSFRDQHRPEGEASAPVVPSRLFDTPVEDATPGFSGYFRIPSDVYGGLPIQGETYEVSAIEPKALVSGLWEYKSHIVLLPGNMVRRIPEGPHCAACLVEQGETNEGPTFTKMVGPPENWPDTLSSPLLLCAPCLEDPEVLVRLHRDLAGTGCCLHITTDDGNVLDEDVDFCVKWAEEHGHSFCKLVGGVIRGMSLEERVKRWGGDE